MKLEEKNLIVERPYKKVYKCEICLGKRLVPSGHE